MAKTYILEVKRFKVRYKGEEFGPQTANGPIIAGVDEKTALALINNSLKNVIEQPQAKIIFALSDDKSDDEKELEEMSLDEVNVLVKGTTTKEGLTHLAKKIEEVFGLVIDLKAATNNDKRQEAIKKAVAEYFGNQDDELDADGLPPLLPPVE